MPARLKWDPGMPFPVYRLLRSLLYRLDPERAHELAVSWLAKAQGSPWLRRRLAGNGLADARLSTSRLGLQFPAPLGMAAGFDKQARCYNALFALGFGHVEIGTTTPDPQQGNPRPRIERYTDEHALVNRLGFPNPGLDATLERLDEHAPTGVLGANIGCNKDTAPETRVNDYLETATALAPHAAYLAINVSSPNTPGLRNLQQPEAVANLVDTVKTALDEQETPRPVLLKLHPDAEDEKLVEIAQAAIDAHADGIIAVNTTTERPASLEGAGEGGLSGQPLKQRANDVVSLLYNAIGDEAPLIGVGGIQTGQDAVERMRAGASLLQAYTGFIFRGPRFPQKVHQEMLERMDKEGIDHVSELVGSRT